MRIGFAQLDPEESPALDPAGVLPWRQTIPSAAHRKHRESRRYLGRGRTLLARSRTAEASRLAYPPRPITSRFGDAAPSATSSHIAQSRPRRTSPTRDRICPARLRTYAAAA